MIAVPPGVRILLAARPVDFRKGMDGLAALVQQALRADPFAGDVFILDASERQSGCGMSPTRQQVFLTRRRSSWERRTPEN